LWETHFRAKGDHMRSHSVTCLPQPERLGFDLPTPEGWKAELTIPRWLIHPQTVTHPSINWVRRRVTTLIETNVLQLSHAITCQFNAGMYEPLR